MGNGRLGSLVLLRDADAVSIVPHVHEHGDLQDTCGVHGFPEQAFRCACIANGSDGNFIAPCGESRFSLRHLIQLPVELGCLRQSEQPRHLATRGADVCGAVELGHVVHPFAVFGQKPRGKMTAHLPSRRGGFTFDVGIGVERSEILAHIQQPSGHHQRLIAVVARAPVAVAHHLGKGNLRQFFSIPKNAKLGLSSQHLFAAEQRSFTADASKTVIVQQQGSEIFLRRRD